MWTDYKRYGDGYIIKLYVSCPGNVETSMAPIKPEFPQVLILAEMSRAASQYYRDQSLALTTGKKCSRHRSLRLSQPTKNTRTNVHKA
jgi:hypothetical protein